MQLVSSALLLEGGEDLLLLICVFQSGGLGQEDVVPQLHPACRVGVFWFFVPFCGDCRTGDLVLFVQLLREGQLVGVAVIAVGREDVDGEFGLVVAGLVLLLLLAHGNMRFHVIIGHLTEILKKT